MGDTPIGRLLLKLSPPVMLALLIQSIYNIVDSCFVAQYSLSGLTALSIIFPIQLLMTALGTGTGTGLNILISRMDGNGDTARQRDVVKSGLYLGIWNFLIFTCIGMLLIGSYYTISSNQAEVRAEGIQYAQIIFLGSFGLFMESNCTKLLQAKGNMVTPMLAQVAGAAINLVFDPIFIFGLFGAPELGVAGAAIATIMGQWAAMLITLKAVFRTYDVRGTFRFKDCIQIYQSGFPSIIMQSLYTLYIVGLNLILKQFTEDAVTVLGIYYKLQTFFFIPLMGLQQVIVPVISFNYGAHDNKRVNDTLRYSILISCGVMALGTDTLRYSILISCGVMALGTFIFMAFPKELISVFADSTSILDIGTPALRIISVSFLPASLAMMFTVYFQGIDKGKSSVFITVLRQIILLVPLAWLFHFAGLNYVWLTFPVTESIAMCCCCFFYHRCICANITGRVP